MGQQSSAYNDSAYADSSVAVVFCNPSLVLEVASRLGSGDMLRASACNRCWCEAAHDDDLWRELYARDFDTLSPHNSTSWRALYAEAYAKEVRRQQEKSIWYKAKLKGKHSYLAMPYERAPLKATRQTIGPDHPLRKLTARQRMLTHCDYSFRIVVIGESCVGKTSFLERFVDNSFGRTCIVGSSGIDFKIKTVHSSGKALKLQLWDTMGQERFRSINSSYIRGTHCVLVMYDITDRASFEACDHWYQTIEMFGEERVVVSLVGCKSDLEHKRKVSFDEGAELAVRWAASGSLGDVAFTETSSKVNVGIEQTILYATEKLLAIVEPEQGQQASPLLTSSENPRRCAVC